MNEIANALVKRGKGVLAADESTPTIKKRFDVIGVESTEETRLAYRTMLFTTPDLNKYISGIILFDETIRQTIDGIPVPQYLESIGIIPGIKVDKGAKPLALGLPAEKVTEGLDGLRERLIEYRELGAKFTKWRGVLSVDSSQQCIIANAHALARFAALSQEAGLVPIVEPEVLLDGDFGIDRVHDTTKRVWNNVFDSLFHQNVALKDMILKPNMILAGYEFKSQPDDVKAVTKTLDCLLDCVPARIPGVAFLSGGQPDEKATERLRLMNSRTKASSHWNLTFSFGRALQQPALKAWQGRPENVVVAQEALLHRAKLNSEATFGE